MNPSVHITRHSFYSRPGAQTQRFTEHAPPVSEPEHDHDLCGCTRTVSDRPKGYPSSVRQEVSLEATIGEVVVALRLEAHRDEDAVRFWIRWPGRATETPSDYATWHEAMVAKGSIVPRKDAHQGPHAYFWSSRTHEAPGPGFVRARESFDNLQIEVTGLPGIGRTDALLGHLYFGNAVDTSQFFNGHAPSRIVDLGKLGPGDVWAHQGSFGREAMAVLDPTDETRRWQALMGDMAAILDEVRPALRNDLDVEATYRLAADSGARARFAPWAAFLADLLVGKLPEGEFRLEATQMFRTLRELGDPEMLAIG